MVILFVQNNLQKTRPQNTLRKQKYRWKRYRSMKNTKELMHCHCGTNNRAPRWTFTDPCKPEVRPGAREESASPAWLAAPAMNACDTTKGIYGALTLDVDWHYIHVGSVTAQTHHGKRHNNTWVGETFGIFRRLATEWRRIAFVYDIIGNMAMATNADARGDWSNWKRWVLRRW